MLSDFLVLEMYYETPNTAQFFEDISDKYGMSAVDEAMRAGHITGHALQCGPDSGRWLFWLTDEGRRTAKAKSRMRQ